MARDESYYNKLFSDDIELTEPLKGTDETEMLFILTFWEEDAFSFDFPIIASEFLKHEAASLSEYTDGPYFREVMHQRDPREGFKIKITSMMLSAARKGSGYSQELFRRLYKTYYKREYNVLKRFQTISFDELMGFENDEEVLAETCARVLTIAPFFGITLHFSCVAAYQMIQDDVKDMPYDYLTKPEFLDFPEGLFDECIERTDGLADGDIFSSRKLRKLRDIFKFKQNVFRYYGVTEGYDAYLNQEVWGRKRSLAITFALLKMTFPKREFTDEELLYYLEIFDQITAYTSQFAVLEDDINLMFGMKDGYEHEREFLHFKPFEPDEKAIGHTKKENVPPMPMPSPDNTADAEKLLRENAELKILLSRAKANLKNAASEQAESRRTIRELQAMERQQEDLRRELQALREFAYQTTEEDVAAKEPDYSALEKTLRTKRIVIVGGHDNWTSQLRDKFPDWVYVRPGASGAGDVRVMNNADAVYFFTDFISHSTYGKYVRYARETDIPFRYIHSTNIRANVQQMAGDLEITDL